MPTPSHEESLKPESVEEILKSVNEWFEEFMSDKAVIPQRRGFPKEDNACLYSLQKLVRTALTKSFTAGRSSIIKEINEKYEE